MTDHPPTRTCTQAILTTAFALSGILFAFPFDEARAQTDHASLRAFLERTAVEWRYVIGGEEIVEKSMAEFLPGGAIVVPDAEGYPRHDPDMLWELRDSEDGLHLVLGDPYEPTHGMAWRITSFDGRRIAAVLELPGEETIGLRLVAVDGVAPTEDAARRDRLVGTWLSGGLDARAPGGAASTVTYQFGEDGRFEIREEDRARRGRWMLSRAEWRTPPPRDGPGGTEAVPAQLLILQEEGRPASLYALLEIVEDALTVRSLGEAPSRAGRALRLTRR